MELPVEILLHIFSFVKRGTKTRISILQTSKSIRNSCLLYIWKPWDDHCLGLRKSVENGYIGYFRRWRRVAPEKCLLSLSCSHKRDMMVVSASKGYLDFIKMFKKDSLIYLDPALDNWISFRVACENQQVKIIKYFLENTLISSELLASDALIWACRSGLDKTVKVLLEDGRICPSILGDYCIRKACKYGHTKVVEHLLDDGRADPNAGDGDPIFYAYISSKVDMLEALTLDWRIKIPKWLQSKEGFSDDDSF